MAPRWGVVADHSHFAVLSSAACLTTIVPAESVVAGPKLQRQRAEQTKRWEGFTERPAAVSE